ncbi:MAG: 30S ribosomal protein S21 [Bacteroidota bacterium]
MLVFHRKDEESIDRLLKRYKRKHRNVNLRGELMDRKFFTKKSVRRRNEILDAKYRQENYS